MTCGNSEERLANTRDRTLALFKARADLSSELAFPSQSIGVAFLASLSRLVFP